MPEPTITQPGVYQMADEDYFADPVVGGSLSSTGARKLLPPSCPALYRHWADNAEETSKEFDLGHAAHAQVLGTGPEIAVLDYDSWRTNAVKADAEAARAAGKVPLLTKEFEPLAGMVAALRAHPWTSQILAPGSGLAEQTLIWRDAETGVWCRARLDHIHHRQPGRRLVVVDYKTTVSAAPEDLDRTIYRYGYHIQAAHYVDAVQALGLAPDGVLFLLVFQEKTPPYLPTVAHLSGVALDIGRHLMRQARAIYAECTAAGRWPGYADDDIAHISLPVWVERAYEQEQQQ